MKLFIRYIFILTALPMSDISLAGNWQGVVNSSCCGRQLYDIHSMCAEQQRWYPQNKYRVDASPWGERTVYECQFYIGDKDPCDEVTSNMSIYFSCNKSSDSGAPSCPSNPGAGNPIIISNGSKFQRESDYISSKNNDVKITRIYNSNSDGWIFNNFENLSINSESNNSIRLYSEDGSQHDFFGNPTDQNQWFDYSPELVLTATSNGYNVYDGRRVMVFDSEGKLQTKTFESGQSVSYMYRDSGLLDTVRDESGVVLRYFYNALNKVKEIHTADKQVYSYTYQGENLKSIHHSQRGESRVYHYENTNYKKALTGITDERGVRYATWSYDDQGRAISSEHAAVNGSPTEKVTLAFNADGSTTVTNALNKDTTYHFTQINGANKVTQVEGHQSTGCAAANKGYTYYPEGHFASGLLKTKTDWLGVVTYFEYNDRGLEVLKVQAQGTPDEKRTITDWHPTLNLPASVTTSTSKISYSYDANGRLLNKKSENI